MNKLNLITFLLALNRLILSQETLGGPQRELYFDRSNFPSYPPIVEVTNALSSLSAILCHDPGDNRTSYICSECPINSSVTINNYQLGSSGWNICSDDPGSFPYFGYALYKMNNDRTNDFFYIDIRDCNYDTGIYLTLDIKIALNLNYDGLGHSRYEYCVSTYPIVPIANGSVLRIWNIEHLSPPQPYTPNTTCFPNFWENCLILISTLTNHPRLVWGAHPTFNVSNYRIYRAVSNNPVNPLTLNYSLIASI